MWIFFGGGGDVPTVGRLSLYERKLIELFTNVYHVRGRFLAAYSEFVVCVCAL